MNDYSRGWRASRTPDFRRIERRTDNFSRPPKKSLKFWAYLAIVWRFIKNLSKRFWRVRGWWKKLVIMGSAGALVLFIFFGLLFVYYSFALPSPDKLADRVVPESTKIMDRNGKLLYEIHGEAKRTLIPLDQIPQHAKDAVIAIEDKNFYSHGGVSFTGILRAALVNVFSGSLRQGGSTITQLFVRNAVLTREKTFARKFKEIVLSLQIEKKYGKDEILQLFFNEIPYGSNAYGIEAASQTFFSKSAKNLSLLESAYLAALPKGPTYYSPYGPRRDELDARADTVLQLMYEQGYITEAERNQAQNTAVEFRVIGQGILAPHFVLYIQDLLAQKYGELSLQEGGLKVTTSLDLDLQTIAEEAVTKQGEINEQNYKATNAALVSIDPRTGEILAMVGSRDYFNEEIDGAVNVALRPRQPGSSFKPYVYSTAFKEGMSPATMLFDVVTNFGEFGGKDYTPQDYDGKQRGPISIRSALQGSLNIPAVKTVLLVSVEDSIDTAEAMGITTLKDRSRFGPSLVLGGAEVKLLEHTAAYGTFATGGIKHDTVAILKVEDKTGRVLEEHASSGGREVLNAQIAYQINNVLSDNESRIYIFGRNNRLTLPGRPAAAKTGTTQENRDNWVIGYTPSLVTGVWVGNNNNDEMAERAFGSSTTAPIWQEFMRRALEGKPVEEFTRPEGIAEIVVDSLTGKLPTAYSPSTKTEVFASFNAPTESDDVHFAGYNVLHSEKPDDPNWEEPVKAWALQNGYLWEPDDGQSADPTIELSLTAPAKITGAPWSARIEATGNQEVKELELFLDNYLLAASANSTLDYESATLHVSGRHQLTAQVRTRDNKINQKSVTVEFQNGPNLLLLTPRDNQEVGLPTNIVLESNINIAAENAKFRLRNAGGDESEIAGNITKQQLGQIYHYTLNWASGQKPAKGSYQLWGGISGESSAAATIKIP